MLMARQKFVTSTTRTISAVRQTMGIFVVMYHAPRQKAFILSQHQRRTRRHSHRAMYMTVFRHQMPPPDFTRVAKERNGAKATTPAR